MRFLLNTNILSEPLRPRPNQAVVRMLPQNEDEIARNTVNTSLAYSVVNLVIFTIVRQRQYFYDLYFTCNPQCLW